MQHGATTWAEAGRWTSGIALNGPVRSMLALRQVLLAERQRWALWSPVLMAVGVLLYMSPVREPPAAFASLALFVVAAALAFATRTTIHSRRTATTLAILLTALPAGYLAAAWRTASVETISLPHGASLQIEGRIVAIEGRAKGHRLTLDRVRASGRRPEEIPQKVRIGVAKGAEHLGIGDWIGVRARLEAPEPPALPGDYDWARDAWFQGLGGVGWSFGAPKLIRATTHQDHAGLMIENARTALANRIAGATPGPAGAVAAALVTGQRGAVDRDVWSDMQRAGLAHLIAISGLHFTLVAGVVFFLARWGLGLVPAICLRLPAQKGAAIFAMAACAFYLVISGASVPAQRSFVMALIASGAILVDRDPISLRLLSIAAIAVLLVAPQSLLGPSFQLSFAAMVGLIGLYETLARRRDRTPATPRVWWRRALVYLGGIVTTTLVATIATGPFGAWHFGTIATWGVVANMLAIPLTSFVVMPAAVVGTALLPLGLDQPAFAVMGFGVRLVLTIAATVANWPYASFALPGMTASCIALIVSGGLWLAIWQQRWRWLGAPVVAIGLVAALVGQPPRLFISPDAQIVGALTDDGRLIRTAGSFDGRVADAWRKRTGSTNRPEKWPNDARPAPCDAIGCVVRQAGKTVAILTAPGDIGDDCRAADLVVDLIGERRCPLPTISLGYRDLRAARGLEIDLSARDIRLSSVAEARGERPWTMIRRRRPSAPDQVHAQSD